MNVKENYDSYVASLLEEIDRLRQTNIELRSRIESQISPVEFINVLYEKNDLTQVSGYGKFCLKRIDKDRWSANMHDERIELYNKRGRRVRGDINHDGDW